MSFLNKSIISFEPEVFGLDLSDLSVKVIQVEREGKSEKIRSYGSLDIAPGNIEDGKIINKEKVAELIKEAIKKSGPGKINTKKVICSVPESKAFLRIINIPQLEGSEAAEAVKWEMEASIPLSIDQVYFDWQFLNLDDKGKKNILTVAVAKEIIDDLMAVLKMAGLEVYGLEVESIASARSLIDQEKTADKSTSLIIDLGSQRTSFIITVKDVPCFTSSIPFSSESINDAIAKSLNLDPQGAEDAKVNNGIENLSTDDPIFSAIKPLLENLTQEIEKTLDFYGEISKEKLEIEKIILCGGGANLKGLIPYLAKKLRKEVQLGDPWINLHIDSASMVINKESAVRYCTVVGLALREPEYEN